MINFKLEIQTTLRIMGQKTIYDPSWHKFLTIGQMLGPSTYFKIFNVQSSSSSKSLKGAKPLIILNN